MNRALEQPINLTFNKYVPLALLYQFFNSVGLPDGLLYTTLLSPLFIYFNISHRSFKPLLIFLGVTCMYASIHFYHGSSIPIYMRSWLLAFCHFNFCLVIYWFIKQSQSIIHVFKVLLFTNLLLVLIALLQLLTLPIYNHLFWYLIPISPGIEAFPRLKLFASEASVYSLYLTPLFFYYVFAAIENKTHQVGFALLILLVSLTLSFSLGVILCILFALLIAAFWHKRLFFSNKVFNRWLLMSIVLMFIVGIVYYFIKPHNALFTRIANIFNGADTSSRGRTYEAFILANRILEHHSKLFGIGLGQIKTLGRPVILNYYRYMDIPQTVRIPNACSETLIYFGYVGLAIRFLIEGFLFFKCKVYRNAFQLSIFIFVFTYQFTGSYITNLAEYTLWIFACINCFPQFNRSPQSLAT